MLSLGSILSTLFLLGNLLPWSLFRVFSTPCRLCHRTLFLIHLQILISVCWKHLGSQVCPQPFLLWAHCKLQKQVPLQRALSPGMAPAACYGCVWAHIAPVCWP